MKKYAIIDSSALARLNNCLCKEELRPYLDEEILREIQEVNLSFVPVTELKVDNEIDENNDTYLPPKNRVFIENNINEKAFNGLTL